MNTTQPPSPADNPKLSAEEISKRFLKLIEGLHSRNELSVERVQEATGLKLVSNLEKKDFGYNQPLGDGWFYIISYMGETSSSLKGVSLDFGKGLERFPDMLPVCGLDFEHYHKALKAMGYADYPKHGEIGELLEWIYRKGDIELSIVPELKQFDDGKVYPTCVRSIGTLN